MNELYAATRFPSKRVAAARSDYHRGCSLAAAMPDPRTVSDRVSRLYTLLFVVCLGLLGFALYLQHWENLDPCPWCVVQRLGYILVGLIALVGALHRPGPIATVVYSTLGLAASAAGAAAAVYHVYLQSDPGRAAKCVGSPVERILDQLDVGAVIPPLLQYSGPCTLKPWAFLWLSIPEWSLVWFVLLGGAFVAVPFVAKRD
jgi:disulfide bond formation protein DsbB